MNSRDDFYEDCEREDTQEQSYEAEDLERDSMQRSRDLS